MPLGLSAAVRLVTVLHRTLLAKKKWTVLLRVTFCDECFRSVYKCCFIIFPFGIKEFLSCLNMQKEHEYESGIRNVIYFGEIKFLILIIKPKS